MANSIQEALAHVQRKVDEKKIEVVESILLEKGGFETMSDDDYKRWKDGVKGTMSKEAEAKIDARRAEKLKADATSKPSAAAEPSAKPSAAPTPKAGVPATTPTPKPGVSTLGKLGRALPVVGAVLGAKDAYDRYQAGDKVGAGIAAAGGAASFIPGVGGLVGSLGAYGANKYRDSQKDKEPDSVEKDKADRVAQLKTGTLPGAEKEPKSVPTPTPRPKDIDKPTPTPTPRPKEQEAPAPKADYGYARPGSDEDTASNFFRADAARMKAQGGKAANDFSSESGPKKKKVNEALLEAFYRFSNKINR
jgi:hypothetical protein